ncbi:TrbC/VirB2 family protein [Listeria goaensis]|uniref:TrbC/VirB2 family protein n=1 Tax=Listeria goaensis TaxID=1649188 RepID=UPI000B58E20F|nr:TrbC/VirB2 family protein [Listeria goaensis]
MKAKIQWNKSKNLLLEKPFVFKMTMVFFSVMFILLMPQSVYAAKSVGDITSSVNTAGEGMYDFLTSIAFWVGTAMVGLGFFILKFKWIDREGKGGKIIINTIFGIGGLFASPQIIQFVIDLVK